LAQSEAPSPESSAMEPCAAQPQCSRRFIHAINEEEVSRRIARSQALLSRRPSSSPSPVSDSSSSLPGPTPPPLEPPPSAHGHEQQWSFMNTGIDKEEITPPPFARARSSESLSVAHILAMSGGGAPVDDAFSPEPPRLDRSSSIEAAAAALLGATGGCTRRRLEVACNDTSHNPELHYVHPRKPKRARQSDALESVATFDPQDRPKLWVQAIGCHVSQFSSATALQLKLLSAAFQLCPHPTSEQISALSNHVSIAPQELARWFQSRRTLQEWVRQPGAHLQPATLAELFYTEAALPTAQRVRRA